MLISTVRPLPPLKQTLPLHHCAPRDSLQLTCAILSGQIIVVPAILTSSRVPACYFPVVQAGNKTRDCTAQSCFVPGTGDAGRHPGLFAVDYDPGRDFAASETYRTAGAPYRFPITPPDQPL